MRELLDASAASIDRHGQGAGRIGDRVFGQRNAPCLAERHQGGGCLGITHVERAGARYGLGRWVDKKYRASGAQDELVDQPFLARGEARRLGHEQHVEIFRQGLECFRN